LYSNTWSHIQYYVMMFYYIISNQILLLKAIINSIGNARENSIVISIK